MARSIPSFTFVVCLVRHGGRYLLVQERDGSFYLPAGGVEACESITQAAVRETMEEAGIKITPRGLLSVEHIWCRGRDTVSVKWRFIVVADPLGPIEPKRFADEHSLGAVWASPNEISALPLRGPDALKLPQRLEAGAAVAPLGLYEPAFTLG